MEQAPNAETWDARAVLEQFSDERGTTYKSPHPVFSRVGARRGDDESGSIIATVSMLSLEGGPRCEPCKAPPSSISDRIAVSAQVRRDADQPGYLDVEIRSIHGASSTPVFRAQFNCAQTPGINPAEWLVTVSGVPSTQWEVHVSYVPIANPDASPAPVNAMVALHITVDRAGSGAPENGMRSINFNEELVSNNEYAPIIGNLSRDFAIEGPVSSTTYSGPNAPTWAMLFVPDTVAFALTDAGGTDDVYISFDGSTDNVHMVPGTPSAAFSMSTSRWKFWGRSPSGNPVNVQVIATRGGGV